MKIDVTRIGQSFAAEIPGVDARKRPDASTLNEIEAALSLYPVVCLRGQKLIDEEQYQFLHSFGPKFEVPYGAFDVDSGSPAKTPKDIAPLVQIGNLGANGAPVRKGTPQSQMIDANLLWHTDGSYAEKPVRLTALSARSLPRNPPDTLYADMRAAWDALPPARKDMLLSLKAEHSIYYSRRKVGMSEDEFPPAMRAQFGIVEQPLVRTNPRSGRMSLYLAAHAGRIVGWSQEDSDTLIEELIEFATQDQFTYAHKWRDYDLVIWDDSSTMHRATPYPLDAEPRVLRWAAVQEEAPLAA